MRNFINVYMEEAEELPQGGGDTLLDNSTEEQTAEPEQAPERPGYLLDKYMAEDRSIEEATAEQAKAYGELQKRFGSFTGAPEEYELVLSEDLQEAGVTLDGEDPLVQAAMEFAKESEMSQDGFEKMVNLYAEQELAKYQAEDAFKAEQIKALGPNASSRLKSISEWGAKNLDEETFSYLQSMATTAESVKAIEQLIGMTRGKPVDVDNSQHAGGVGVEELRKMQFETDQHGNRRLQTDPEFRKRYNQMAAQVYPGEHRQIVGQ